MVRWTARATHTGKLVQIGATGKRVNVSGVDIYRFRNGKIEDHRIVWDAMTFAQQLGIGQ
jgi:predicted ester cyclase